jgi:hypothetical protein
MICFQLAQTLDVLAVVVNVQLVKTLLTGFVLNANSTITVVLNQSFVDFAARHFDFSCIIARMVVIYIVCWLLITIHGRVYL